MMPAAFLSHIVPEPMAHKTDEQGENVEEIFGETLDRSLDEREAFLDEACGDNLYLCQQVNTLLFLVHRIG